MSSEAIKELARERLAAAELACTLGVPVSNVEEPPEQPRRARWLVAATLLLGLGVAGGAAWMRSGEEGDDTEAQQRGPNDVVDPWWHKDFSRFNNRLIVSDGAALANDVDAVEVRLPGKAQSWLVGFLKKPQIRFLTLQWRSDSALTAADWRAIAAMPNLECLFLAPAPELRIEHLRELRHAPKLESVWLEPVWGGAPASAYGKNVVAALAELPRLRMVSFFGCKVTRDALIALAGLQNLDALMLDRVAVESDLFYLLSGLTQLRSLSISSPTHGWDPLADHLHEIKRIPRLTSLELAVAALQDSDLRSLPEQLESLRIFDASKLTAAGVSTLGQLPKLRSLAFRSSIPIALHEAVASVIETRELENFECLVQSPTPRIWQALQRSPRLAGLAIFTVPHQPEFAQQLIECSKLPHLRDLELKLAIRPEPSDLSVLRKLKNLRVVRLTRFSIAPGWPSAEERKALEACLGPDVDIIISG
tara:strand:+ start:15 stop:1448 length:1434 start_codon:yes stop_codon:yes gene_type:complete